MKAKTKVLNDIYPKEWLDCINQDLDVIEFRNLNHFKSYIKDLKPMSHGASDSSNRTMPLATAIDNIRRNVPRIESKEYQIIYDQVRSTLIRRGLISETIYEGIEYDIEGDNIDIARYIEQNPECCIKPKKAYDSYFYELYISMAYLSGVRDRDVLEGLSKILATIQLLEQEHIYIKVTVVTCSQRVTRGTTQMVLIPLWSYKDYKSIEEMSAVLNEGLFRNVIFAIRENTYGDKLSSGYGSTIDLPKTIPAWNVDVETIASEILDKTIQKGTR